MSSGTSTSKTYQMIQGESKKSAIVTRVPFCKILNIFSKITGWYEYYINSDSMCNKKKKKWVTPCVIKKKWVNCSFIKLVTVFLPWESMWQNLQFCPWQSIWSKAWNIPILGVELKRHRIHYQCSTSSVCHQSCVFFDSVNFCKLLDWKR